MKGSVIWIAGGVDKGNDYKDLIPLVNQKVKAIICLGIDNSKLIEFFSPYCETIISTDNIKDAVVNSHKLSEKMIQYSYLPLVQVLIYLKILKIEEINLKKK